MDEGWHLAWLKLFILMVGLAFNQAGIAPLVADSMMLVASLGLIFQLMIVVIKPPEGLKVKPPNTPKTPESGDDG